MTQPFANATNCKFSTTLSDNDPSTIFDLSHVFHTLFVRSSWVDYLENTSADFQNPIPFHFILGASKGKSIVYTSTPFFRQLLLIVFGIQLQIVNSLVQRGAVFLTS